MALYLQLANIIRYYMVNEDTGPESLCRITEPRDAEYEDALNFVSNKELSQRLPKGIDLVTEEDAMLLRNGIESLEVTDKGLIMLIF